MRYLFIGAILFGMATGTSYAHNNDSISTKQLDEVVVKANLSSTDAGGIYFIPSGRQKATAQNGIDLLRRMAIPQIKISLADDNVTTNTGEAVTIYINYTKASSEELEGLRTSDVRKVEYFYSPADQRFMGDRNVVNIIVQPHACGEIGIAVTANLLGGNLQLQLMPSQFFYKSTGYYNMDYNPSAFSCSAVYYTGNFYFSGFYEMKNRTMWSNSGTIYKDRSQLQISAGWSNSDLNIRIGLSNPFRTSWAASTKNFETHVYREHVTSYGTTAHFNLHCSVVYTFGYGKKVSRSNEVGEQSAPSSAILK